MQLSTTVVICAYTNDRWLDLGRAIKSVESQRQPPNEIILVIDHNRDLETRARAAFPGTFVVANSESKGLSGARNTGVHAAKGDVIAFLDDDAAADVDWLSNLLPAFDNPKVVGAGGTATPDWATDRPAWFPEEFDWVIGCSYRGLPDHVAPVRNALGCNMAYRRRAFTAVGGFRRDFGRVGTTPLGDEETEFSVRLSKYDPTWQILYVPNARVLHRVPGTRATKRYFLGRCFSEGLSKAHLRRVAGAQTALSSERQYATRTLPAGFVRLVGGGEFRRAAMIVVGLSVTVAGFLTGSIRGGSVDASAGSVAR
jgi:GT2 family glycosyltransferase